MPAAVGGNAWVAYIGAAQHQRRRKPAQLKCCVNSRALAARDSFTGEQYENVCAPAKLELAQNALNLLRSVRRGVVDAEAYIVERALVGPVVVFAADAQQRQSAENRVQLSIRRFGRITKVRVGPYVGS